jgi:site-specific DNA-methyltransferase (adenine-specific)
MLNIGKGRIVGKYKDKGEIGAKWFEEFHDTEENYMVFLGECQRVLKKDRHIYIMFDSYSLLSLAPIVRRFFDVKNLVCWDKVNIGLGHSFRRRHEFVCLASKGKRKLSSKAIPDVWRIKRVSRMKYPTQKPTEVFEVMIKASAEKGFIVCDPFLGSGSSMIAALKNECCFLGADISQEAINVSQARVKTFLDKQIDPLQPKSLLGDDVSLNRFMSHNTKQDSEPFPS